MSPPPGDEAPSTDDGSNGDGTDPVADEPSRHAGPAGSDESREVGDSTGSPPATDETRGNPTLADSTPGSEPERPATGDRTGVGQAGADSVSGSSRGRNPPPAKRARDGEGESDDWVGTFVVDIVSSAVAVLLVGFFLFTVSGIWPPLVAVESPSMTPQMKTGDLVFVMEEHRFAGGAAHGDTGVVTARAGEEADYYKFSEPGDVIVYEPNGSGDRTPIIHRAMFWVEKDERWYDRADKGAVGNADSCEELANCPAPHAGFITKGDANPTYDQVGPNPHSPPVKPKWVVGTAETRIPGVGCIRLRSKSCGFGLDTSFVGDDLLNVTSRDGPLSVPS